MTDRDLQRAAERFADTVHEDVQASVRQAWALERDRLYAELAELRDEVHSMSHRVQQLAEGMQARHEWVTNELHSVKVRP